MPLGPVLESGADPVEVGPPQQAGEHARGDEGHHRAAGDAVPRLEGLDHGQADGDDDLAEGDDHDESVALGEVAGPDDPVAAAGGDHGREDDGDAEEPEDGPSLAVDEGAGDEHGERGRIGRLPADDRAVQDGAPLDAEGLGEEAEGHDDSEGGGEDGSALFEGGGGGRGHGDAGGGGDEKDEAHRPAVARHGVGRPRELLPREPEEAEEQGHAPDAGPAVVVDEKGRRAGRRPERRPSRRTARRGRR